MPSRSRPVVVVTGGSRGIGRSVCLRAAEAGYDVCFSFRRDEAAAGEVVRRALDLGARCRAIKADMASPADVGVLFATAVAEFGRIDGVVNNAGMTGRVGRFLDSDPAEVDRVIDCNLRGVMTCCREALKHLGEGGAIVNVSSGAAQTGSPNTYIWYAATKAAVETFSLGLAREMAASGIRVNVVSPGVTDTDIHAEGGRPQSMADLAKVIPINRVAEPDEIARPILWLLSAEASYVVGAVLRVGGGR